MKLVGTAKQITAMTNRINATNSSTRIYSLTPLYRATATKEEDQHCNEHQEENQWMDGYATHDTKDDQ
jgi:hypothetical protein